MNYRIVRRLGRGGTGVVDLAVDEAGHEVALKRVSLYGTPEEMARARRRIHREAEVLAQLDHPAIVRLHEVVDDGDDLVLVMDHLPGGNLSTRVNLHGPLPAEELRTLAARLLDGLAAAHRRGIVHRDIKPANVLLDDAGHARLADFGAATHRDATPGLTATAMVLGTPGFMAPEQAAGEPATAASDVFSLGATLFFASTGEGPFGTGDPRVLMLRAASGRVGKIPKELPADLRRLLSSMLDPDPRRRPTAAEARGGTEARGGAAGTRPRPAITGFVRRVRHRPLLGVGAVALTLLLIAGLLLVGGPLGGLLGSDDDIAIPTTTDQVDPTRTTEACTDKPYQPCGQPVAPNTDGWRCVGGAQDYDGDPSTGCEAVPDGIPDGTELTADRPIRGTIVPANDVDRFRRPVEDRFNLLGDGTVKIRLTAPTGAVYRLTVYGEDGEVMATDVSTNGQELVLSFTEPSPIFDDSTTFTVEVRNEEGFRPSADPYLLTTSGQY